jgi:hypothetical protein
MSNLIAIQPISGAAVSISGSTILQYGFDPSGNTWNAFYINASGQHAIQAGLFGKDAIASGWNPISTTASGDAFRLRVSQEGMAPTYVVNASNVTITSGVSAVSPLFAIMNFGSGATAATAKIKIKYAYIQTDASVISGTNVSPPVIKFDFIRMKQFSGGGTILSGVAYDPTDPVWSGTTMVAPTIQSAARSGAVLDGIYFSYITSTAGYPVNFSGLLPLQSFIPYITVHSAQTTNLITQRMPDMREIIITSGYGFAIEQSSGNSYTVYQSGGAAFNITVAYSIE